MKDCSSCKQKPKAGARYEDTPCAKCRAWEPENNKRKMDQKPDWWWRTLEAIPDCDLTKVHAFRG